MYLNVMLVFTSLANFFFLSSLTNFAVILHASRLVYASKTLSSLLFLRTLIGFTWVDPSTLQKL